MLEGTESYTVRDDDDDDPVLVHHPSGSDVDTWREGYPYDHRMSRPEYEEQKLAAQEKQKKMDDAHRQQVAEAAKKIKFD